VRITKEVNVEYAVKFLRSGKHYPAFKDATYKWKAASWKYWEDHWFFTTIGFDQLLHGLTLIYLAGALL
jgi:hypothetical protein